MKSYEKFIRSFILASIIAGPAVVGSWASTGSLEKHIRGAYLEPHEIFVARAVNRFHSMGRARIHHLIPRCPDDSACVALRLRDGLFIVRRNLVTGEISTSPLDRERSPEIREYRNLLGFHLAAHPSVWAADIVLESLVRTPRGKFVFIRHERLEKESAKLTPADLKLPRIFYQGFVRILDGRVTGPEIQTALVRPPTEEYERELWDVFVYEGREHILIRKLTYDAELFEVFIDENGDEPMRRVLEFVYSGD